MWDAMAQFYPWRSFYHEALHNGQLPLWNPYQFCGTPQYANVQSAIFYPPNLLFYFLTPARAFGFAAALHLFLAGLFAFLFARYIGASRAGATVSGIVYALCAFNITWLELPTFLNVAAWLPLILMLIAVALARRSSQAAVGTGLALGMAILAGHFQIAFYVILAALAWALWRYFESGRPSGSMRLAGITAITALSLGAAQILPSMELAMMSHRAGSATLAGYFRYAETGLPAMNLLTAFVPDFFGNPSSSSVFWGLGNYAEFALYVGMLPFVLAVASLIFSGRKGPVRFFGILAALSLLIALGTPINALLYFGVPGWSSTGSPARILLLYCFSVSMLAGFGATAFTTSQTQSSRRVIAGRMSMTGLVLGIVILLFAIAGLYTWIAISHFSGISTSETDIGYGVLIAIGMLFVAASILVWRAADKMGSRVAATLIILVTIMDLALFGYHYNAISPLNAVYPPTKSTDYLKETSNHDRIMPINPAWSLYNTPPAVLPPNSATVYKLDDVQGYDSLFPGYYKRFAGVLQGQDPSPVENGNMVFFKSYLPRAARYAKYIVSGRPIADRKLELVHEGDVFIYANLSALPRVEFHDEHVTDAQSSVTWLRDSPNSVELRISSLRGGTVILRDTNYPGWRAMVDERQEEIHSVESVFRSVTVPPGQVALSFDFAPSSLRIGMYISMLCLAACTAFAVITLATRSGGRSA